MDGWVFLCLLPVPNGSSFALGLTRVHSYEGNIVPRTNLLIKHTLTGLDVFFFTYGKKCAEKAKTEEAAGTSSGSSCFSGAMWQLWALSFGKTQWPVIPGAGGSRQKAPGAAWPSPWRGLFCLSCCK